LKRTYRVRFGITDDTDRVHAAEARLSNETLHEGLKIADAPKVVHLNISSRDGI